MNENAVRVQAVLANLIKAALVSDDALSLDFRKKAAAAQRALAADPPPPDSVKIDGIWTLAIREAESPDLQPEEGRVNLTLPQTSVIALDELAAPDFDVDAAVERIAQSASTG